MLKPSNISGIKLWVDFTDVGSITVDASNKLSSVTDKSGNGNTLVQATGGNQPTYNYDGGNGYGCMNLATNQFVAKTFSLSVPYTIYFYARINTFTHNASIIQMGGSVNYIWQGPTNLIIASGSNNHPGTATAYSRYNAKWSLFMFSLDASGNYACSADNERILGLDTRFDNGVSGTSPVSIFTLSGDTIAGANVDMQEVLLISGGVATLDDVEIRNYFFNKYRFVTPPALYGIGDSVVNGQNASVIGTTDHVTLIASGLSIGYMNFGIPATSLGYPPDSVSSGQDFLDLLVSADFRNTNSYILIGYGLNDGATTLAWKAAYKNAVVNLINRGFDKKKICLRSTTYVSGNVNYPVTNGYIQAIASETGTRYADVYTALQGIGQSAVHPDDTGHALMATTVLAALA